MPRFTVNMHHVRDDDDNMGMTFPLNTYTSDSVQKVLQCIDGALRNPVSGINRIVLLNHDFDIFRLKEADVGQAPQDLDEVRVE